MPFGRTVAALLQTPLGVPPPHGQPGPPLAAEGQHSQAYEDPDADFQVAVDVRRVDPEKLQPGGAIVPADAQRSELKADDRAAKAALKAEQKQLAQERLRAFERGEQVPAEVHPHTIGQIAHRLLQAGDYDNGPPYPLHREKPPPWRHRQGPEFGNVVVKTDKTRLGAGISVEIPRCFVGDVEVPCGAGSGGISAAALAESSIIGPGGAATATAAVAIVEAQRRLRSRRLGGGHFRIGGTRPSVFL
mmetsp:Transcript_8542/g.18221  ORF Transcript_8542/g.18221 Transcript_8542/m.18221 type:complete len:246 (+) Transcript_8542:74-811(+)